MTMNVPVEEIIIDGTNDENQMEGSVDGAGLTPPFALFSPTLQDTVGGPYADWSHAVAALEAIKQGKMVPYTPRHVCWTVAGKPSPYVT